MSDAVLSLVDEVAYQSWQEHIIYEKKRTRIADVSPAEGQANGVAAGGGSGNGQFGESGDGRRHEVRDRQMELMAAVEAGPAACSRYLLHRLRVKDAPSLRAAIPDLPERLTSAAMQRLPRYDETKIAEKLSEVSPAEAATPAYWAACHAIWIEQDYFDDLSASFLEGTGADTAEAKTRNFLRRSGGLERIRGKVSVLMDCPISMAWWRVRIANEIVDEAPKGTIDVEAAHAMLHDHSIWPELTGLSVKRITSLNAPRARAAAIVALHQHDALSYEIKASLRKAQCQGALRALGRLSHSFSLDTVPWENLLRTATEGIHHAERSTGQSTTPANPKSGTSAQSSSIERWHLA